MNTTLLPLNTKGGFIRTIFFCIALVAFSHPDLLYSQQEKTAKEKSNPQGGQRDFDFEVGTWKTHLSRLLQPLSGSTKWAEYEGVTKVSKVWNGDANLVELTADGPAGHFEGLSLRLYMPEARQWTLNFANKRNGELVKPMIGEFKNGQGEFYGQETFNGRAIFVRFNISPITADSIRFEQAFSEDGGKTWEVNWIATDTRIKDDVKMQ